MAAAGCRPGHPVITHRDRAAVVSDLRIALLKRWKAEVGIFFEGTGPDSSDDQIRAIAPKHPAFEVLPIEKA